jgi:hypothetical protein
MGGGGKAPTRNLYDEISGELQAKLDLMPQLYGAEAEYRPQFSGLELTNLNDILFGTAAGTREQPVTTYTKGFRNTRTGEFATAADRAANPKGNAPGSQPNAGEWVPWEQPSTTTKTFKTAATPGLKGITAAADPANAALWDKLTQTATSELDLGADLDPGLLRQAQQSVRSRYQGTLGAAGPAGDFKEALGISEFANTLRNQRRSFATGIAGTNDARTQQLLSQAMGISGAAGPRLFGSGVNVNDVYSSNQNAAAANSASKAAQNNALIGTGVGAGAAILAALI